MKYLFIGLIFIVGYIYVTGVFEKEEKPIDKIVSDVSSSVNDAKEIVAIMKDNPLYKEAVAISEKLVTQQNIQNTISVFSGVLQEVGVDQTLLTDYLNKQGVTPEQQLWIEKLLDGSITKTADGTELPVTTQELQKLFPLIADYLKESSVENQEQAEVVSDLLNSLKYEVQ